MSRFCMKCGSEIPEKSEFCPNCGNKVGNANAVNKKNSLYIIGGGIAAFVLVIVIVLVATLGGNTSESTPNENKANSEFEKAIQNFKNSKSINFSYEIKSNDLGSDYADAMKGNITVDYKTQIMKRVETYYGNSFTGGASKEETYYVNLNLKREYSYGKDTGYNCDKWWYGSFNNLFSSVHDAFESIKYLMDEDIVKKVSTNYRVEMSNSKNGIADIGVENGNIKYIIYSYSSGSVSTNIEIDINSYNSDSVSLPSDVRNALFVDEINRVCDE